MAAKLVDVNRVSKSFKLGQTTVNALVDVSVSAEPGGIIALMGPSGSGKSTLLNLIGALDSPTSGDISVAGTNLNKMGKDARASFRNAAVGFIFQNFNLIPILTTIENVLLPYQLSGTHDQSAEKRAKVLLEKVGLSSQINQSVNRLSGGQMQRVSIARALINRPKLILADEPTANLDHATSDIVLEVMRDLCLTEGATVIMATHDYSVLKFCDRIISLEDGKLVKDEVAVSAASS